MSIYDWNIQEALNANSDSEIKWQTGQLAGCTNGSMRKIMQRFSEYLHDLAIKHTIESSLNSGYNVTFLSKIKQYSIGMSCYMLTHRNSYDNDNFSINNIKSLPLYLYDFVSNSYRKVKKNELLKDACYFLYFCKNIKGENGWVIKQFYHKQKLRAAPIGSIVAYASDTILPTNWSWCDGASLDKSRYNELYTIIKKIWTEENPEDDHFKLPDFRGVFLRGLDPNNIFKDAYKIGVEQPSCNKLHTHIVTTSLAGEHTHNVIWMGDTIDTSFIITSFTRGINYLAEAPISQTKAHTHNITISQTKEASESRPVNYAINYIIKIEN